MRPLICKSTANGIFMAVYHDAIDHWSHLCMKYHPPKQKHVDAERYERYNEVVASGYRFHDMMLERHLALADEDTTVIRFRTTDSTAITCGPACCPRNPLHPRTSIGILGFSPCGARRSKRRNHLRIPSARHCAHHPPALRPARGKRHGRQRAHAGLCRSGGSEDGRFLGTDPGHQRTARPTAERKR